jgi:hypothetical protein
MPNRERFLELQLEGKAEKTRLGLRFTERALYAWETRGYTLPTREELRAGHTAKLKQLLWAGLEGFRVFHAEDRTPWTLDSVNDLVEAGGGWGEWFSGPVLDAYAEAFPDRRRPDQEAPAAGKGPAVTDPPAASGPTGPGSSSTPSATA